MHRERFTIGVSQLHLPCRSGGLQILEPGAALVDSENRTADRDRPGRHDEHLVGAAMQVRDILTKAAQPTSVDVPVRADEQGRADLDDEAPVIVDSEKPVIAQPDSR